MGSAYEDESIDSGDAESDFAPSKSALKRRMTEIQNLCDLLSKLNLADLQSIDLPESLLDSLMTARRLKSSNARNRQLRHSAKLLDNCEESVLERITKYFEDKKANAQSNNRRHKLIEDWRDKLIENPNHGLAALIDDFPDTNRQELRTLVRLAAKEKARDAAPHQQRKLFTYLRDRVIPQA